MTFCHFFRGGMLEPQGVALLPLKFPSFPGRCGIDQGWASGDIHQQDFLPDLNVVKRSNPSGTGLHAERFT